MSLRPSLAWRLGRTAFMSRSQNGRGSWMPASIAGDTWPGVLATLRSERTSGLPVPRYRNFDSMRTYCSAGATS